MWKKDFSNDDLEAGRAIYKEGLVDDFALSDNNVSARVMDKNISITFTDDGIESMYCDCRYCCRHLAAALYFLDSYQKKDYSDFISSFSHEELADFLKDELPQNPELLVKLELYKNADVDSAFYKKKLRQCFTSYVKVINFINVDLKNLKRCGHIDLLLELLGCIVGYLDELNDIGMYDEYEVICSLIGDMINGLIDSGYAGQVSGFLAHFILNSEDDGICDYFGYLYSRIGDPEELFDD